MYKNRTQAAYWDGTNAVRRNRGKRLIFLHTHRRGFRRYTPDAYPQVARSFQIRRGVLGNIQAKHPAFFIF